MVLILLALAFALMSLGGFAWEAFLRWHDPGRLLQLTRDDASSVERMELKILKELEGLRLCSRIAPMLRLVATMIPLGPALVAVATSDDTDWLDALMRQRSQRKLASYAFYGPRQNIALFDEMTRHADGSRAADLIVNASLVFRPNEIKGQLDQVRLPVLQTLPSLAMNADQWRTNAEGLASADISYYYASSELAGMIDPLLITARNSQTGSLEPIAAQVQALADKAAAMIHLQQTPTGERRVGVFVYNYPLGEGNFGASFLNVPESLANILAAMRATGYRITDTTADELTAKIKSALNVFYDADAMSSQLTRGDAEMAQLFVERMGFAFGVDGSASDLFVDQLSEVDAAMASRSSNTYAMLTSDDRFTYIGGLALAARVFSNHTPKLYVQNLRDESEVIVDSAARAIAKEMQSRYLHPQWIKSQIDEGYSGTLQVLKTTQFLWGWQVTAPQTVRDDQWDSLFDVYVQDKYELGTMNWMKRENEAALAQMLERMIDAARLGYWDTDEETMKTLIQTYQSAKKTSDLKESHAGVAQFVSLQLAEQPVILPDSNSDTFNGDNAAQIAASTDKMQSTSVRGIELKPILSPPISVVHPNSSLAQKLGWRAAACLVLAGMLRQQRRFSRRGKSNR